METKWTILHLTDFHISNPSGSEELLRQAHYDTYINELVESVETPINFIVVTGDMVDSSSDESRSKRGDNFAHSERILDFLSTKFNIDKKYVFLCPGNHDLLRDTELRGDLIGARSDFSVLSGNFGNQNPIWHTPDNRATLYQASNDVLVLILDSTVGAKGENKSGNLDNDESDEIILAVKKRQKTEDLLVIASHHPPALQDPLVDMMDELDPAWIKNHLWWQAIYFYKELSKSSRGPVLWLSGDIHKDGHFVSDRMHTVVTGRFGGKPPQFSAEKTKEELLKETHKISQMHRQARVVQISNTGQSHSILLEYKFHGHKELSSNGYWQPTNVEPGLSKPERKGRTQKTTQGDVVQASQPDRKDCPLNKQQTLLELLDEDIQRHILSVIADERLYSMGRFVTCRDRTSLSWIPIGALLNNGELLVAVIGKMASWIKTRFSNTPAEKVGIVGIDSWGAVFASQISVMTGARNFCVAARAEGITHTESERVSQTVINGLIHCDVIILICDVIGTGRSLRYVSEKLNDGFNLSQGGEAIATTSNRTWAIISVICDEYCERDELSFAKFNVTACKDLRMPVLSNDGLPDINIFPPEIAFC